MKPPIKRGMGTVKEARRIVKWECLTTHTSAVAKRSTAYVKHMIHVRRTPSAARRTGSVDRHKVEILANTAQMNRLKIATTTKHKAVILAAVIKSHQTIALSSGTNSPSGANLGVIKTDKKEA